MVEAARLSVVVDADTKALQAGVKSAHDAMTGFGTAATKAFTGAASAGTSFLGAISHVGIGVFGLSQLGGAIGSVATGMVAGNAEMETYATQLTTLLGGSADKAKERLAQLAKFGAETPFELPEIVRAEKVLLGFGLTGQKALDLTGKSADQLRTVIGDVAAGTGASFEEIALNFGKFSAGATGESISRLQELGVVTREQLQGMGIEFSKSGELISPLPKAMAAAVTIAQQKFGGGMDALSKTFSGQMSTLSDNFNQAKNVVTQPIFDVLKTAVGGINDVLSGGGFQATLKSVADLLAGGVKRAVDAASTAFGLLMDIVNQGGDLGVFADDLREAFGIDITPLVTLTRAIGEALPAALATAQAVIGQTLERLGTFFSSLAGGETLATAVNKAFGDLIPAGLNPILDAVDAAFKAVKTTVGDLIATIQTGGLAALWTAIQAAMADFAPTGERVTSVIDAVTKAVAALIPQPLKDMVAGLLDTATAASSGQSPLKGLADAVNTVSGAVADAVDWLKQHEVILYAVAGAVGALTAVLIVQEAVTLAAAVATGVMTAAQYALNLALSLNPIGVVVIALGALVGALIYAYKNSQEFRDVVDAVWAAVKLAITTVIDAVQIYLDRLGSDLNTLGGVMRTLAATAATVFGAILATVSAAWTGISTATTDTWNAIVAFVGPIWSGLQSTAASVFGAIQSTVETVWSAVSTAITTAVSTASTSVGTYLGAIEAAFSAVQSAISGIVDAIASKVSAVFSSAVSTANSAKDTIKSILDTVQGWYDKIVGLVARARDILAHLPTGGGTSGGGGGTSPTPSAPGSDEPAPPAMPAPPTLRPVGPNVMAMGLPASGVVVNVILPTGAYVGSVAEFARILSPELQRVVAMRV